MLFYQTLPLCFPSIETKTTVSSSFSECVRRPDPPNGKIECESKRYAAGKSCFLTCDKGYIPLGKTFMTCKEDEDTSDFDWSIDQPEFVCVRPIGMFLYSIFHLWQLFAHSMC